MPTPAAKLLEEIIILKDKTIPYTRINHLADAPEVVEELVFRAIEQMRPLFEAISGFGRTSLEYRQAAEIHRALLEPILTDFPELKRQIPTQHTYYT